MGLHGAFLCPDPDPASVCRVSGRPKTFQSPTVSIPESSVHQQNPFPYSWNSLFLQPQLRVGLKGHLNAQSGVPPPIGVTCIPSDIDLG